MPALSVLDLAMFVLESRERHFNVGPLIVIDPPEKQRAKFADRLLVRMMKRPVGPPFNYKLHAPLLGVPSLEVDTEFDLSRHVHRITLDAPGSLQQLFDRACKLHERHLDRAHPLWEMYIIDGLEGGKVALFGRMHHGVIDGRTFVTVVSQWLALSPTERTVRAMWEGVPQRKRGGTRRGLLEQVLRALGQAKGTAVSAASLYRMLAEQALAAVGVGSGRAMLLPFTRIPKVLQARSSTRRAFDFCNLPIPAMKALGKAHGVSLNDMLLLTLDVALGRYLHDIGKRPDKPLVTAMPVGLEGAKGGNQIAILQFPLGAPGLSAAARLKQIRRHTGTIKDVIKREAGGTVMLFTTLVHGVPALLEKLGIRGGIAVSNLVVSNPFGMPEKRYLMGGKVELALPLSVVNAGQMLNVTAVTLDDQLQIAFLAIPEAVPRLHKLVQYTREAFDAIDAELIDVHPAKIAVATARKPAARRPAARKTSHRATQAPAT